ncbi:TIGR04222 domain-containing membrane protein [Streptomyces sp. CC208A]|uniref:TIGR04222 domain-containing membrane protein n=1 Tax=Streptomyces sp. CC208A TaxID=3044573 RepID=UPI0024A8705D|nr:TIGR04222 domain-containing membrane protein [Streptomyces sp. CC208A]
MDILLVVLHLAGAAAVVRLVVLASGGRGGPGGPVHDVYEAAFLGGGPGRVADTALATMAVDGRLTIGGPGVVAVNRRTAHDPVERAVLDTHAAAPHGALHHLRLGVMTHPAVQEIGDGLAIRGLVAEPARRRALRRWCALVGASAFVLLPVAIVITVVQWSSAWDAWEEPGLPFFVKVLPLVIGCVTASVLCRVRAAHRLSAAGTAALAAYRREHERRDDTGTVVALRGIRALPDRELWERLRDAARFQGAGSPGHRSRTRSSSRHSSDTSAAAAVVVWCAGEAVGGGDGWGSDSGSGSGSSCGSSGSSCASSSCGSSSSSCGSSSSSSSSCGSSCGSSG